MTLSQLFNHTDPYHQTDWSKIDWKNNSEDYPYPTVLLTIFLDLKLMITLNPASYQYYDDHKNDPDVFDNCHYEVSVDYRDVYESDCKLFFVYGNGSTSIDAIISQLESEFSNLLNYSLRKYKQN